MNIADQFVVGGVEIGKQTTTTEWSTWNQKHEAKPETRLDYNGRKLNKALKIKIVALKVIWQRKV
jgi:hypothetical protein